MLKAKIDKDSNIICPSCSKGEYEIFRRDSLGEGILLNHCKCSCGQLFTYKVDKKDNIILEKDAERKRPPSQKRYSRTRRKLKGK